MQCIKGSFLSYIRKGGKENTDNHWQGGGEGGRMITVPPIVLLWTVVKSWYGCLAFHLYWAFLLQSKRHLFQCGLARFRKRRCSRPPKYDRPKAQEAEDVSLPQGVIAEKILWLKTKCFEWKILEKGVRYKRDKWQEGQKLDSRAIRLNLTQTDFFCPIIVGFNLCNLVYQYNM